LVFLNAEGCNGAVVCIRDNQWHEYTSKVELHSERCSPFAGKADCRNTFSLVCFLELRAQNLKAAFSFSNGGIKFEDDKV